jgi:hypothetical protein
LEVHLLLPALPAEAFDFLGRRILRLETHHAVAPRKAASGNFNPLTQRKDAPTIKFIEIAES